MNWRNVYLNNRPSTYLGYFLIGGIVVFACYYFVEGYYQLDEEINFMDVPPPGPFLAIWGVVGAFAIWFWMLTSFFRSPPEKKRVLWGWLLILGHYVTSSIYFLFVYLPARSNE